MHLEDNFLAGGCFDFVGHIRTRGALPTCLANHCNQNRDLQQSCFHGQKFTPTRRNDGCERPGLLAPKDVASYVSTEERAVGGPGRIRTYNQQIMSLLL
jgi:hypothetical protein